MDFSGTKKKYLEISPGFQVDNDLSTVEKGLGDQEVSPLPSPVITEKNRKRKNNKTGK